MLRCGGKFDNVAWRCFGTSTPRMTRSSSSFCLNLFLFCMISAADLRCTRFSANSAASLICFTRDSSSCLAELIRFILLLRVISKDSISCFSCCYIFVITPSVATDTSRLAIAVIISTSSDVFSSFLNSA